jgi:two-component system, cell cycle sensor histidine kinase and response regulator CckA
MNHRLILTLVLGLVPCLIPPYAFRLTRLFGMKRVGWLLFGVFSLLALLQLVRAWHPMGVGLDPGLMLDLLNFLIPTLLLIGMAHIEALFRERLRLEKEEQRLRARLEVEVKERTADLDKANEELRHEIVLRQQGAVELRISKEQYRFLFDENPQPMWIYDLESFKFLAFNRAALRRYGYTSEEFHELNAKQLYADADVEAFVVESARTRSEAQKRTYCRHRRKDGSVMEVEILTQDLLHASSPARLMLVNDITAQRRLQKELLQSQKAEVTAQLAGGLADRFNRLLSVIDTEAKGLLASAPDADSSERLKRIVATASGAAGLTDQLLAVVRRHPMKAQPLDLNQVVESESRMAGRLKAKSITLEKICQPNLPSVMADQRLVEQILRNLIQNAQDAMPQGGLLALSTAAVRLDEAEAQTRRQEGARPGTYVSVMVSDTGCGMTPEVQSHLFEPFFTTKRTERASGLGLATVHGLVKQHSGWIEVNSQPGAGSKVTVFFPSRQSPGAPSGAAE